MGNRLSLSSVDIRGGARGVQGGVRAGASPNKRLLFNEDVGPLPHGCKCTPLGFALLSDDADMLQALLAAKADPNKPVGLPHKYDMTPLHLAAALCRPGAVSQLLAAGADPAAALVRRSSSKPTRPPDGRPSDYGDQEAAAAAAAAVAAAAAAAAGSATHANSRHAQTTPTLAPVNPPYPNQNPHQHPNHHQPDPHPLAPLIAANLQSSAEGDTPLHTAVRQALQPDLVPLVLRMLRDRGLVSGADLQATLGEQAAQRLSCAFAVMEALLDASATPGSSSSSGGSGGSSSSSGGNSSSSSHGGGGRRGNPPAVHVSNAAGATPLGLALAEPQDSGLHCVALMASHPSLDLIGSDVVMRAVGQRARLPHAGLLLAAVEERAAAAGAVGSAAVRAAAQRLLNLALSLYCGDNERVRAQTLAEARTRLAVARSSARVAADRGWSGGRQPRLQQPLQFRLVAESAASASASAPEATPMEVEGVGAAAPSPPTPRREQQGAQQAPQQRAQAGAVAAAAAAAAGQASQRGSAGSNGGDVGTAPPRPTATAPPQPRLELPAAGPLVARILRKTLLIAAVGLLARGLLGPQSTVRVAVVMAVAGVCTDSRTTEGAGAEEEQRQWQRQRQAQQQARAGRQGAVAAAVAVAAAAAAAAPAGGGGTDGLGGECCVCMSARAVVGFVHGDVVHNCVCDACMQVLQQQHGGGGGSGSRQCPICKRQAQAVVRVVST